MAFPLTWSRPQRFYPHRLGIRPPFHRHQIDILLSKGHHLFSGSSKGGRYLETEQIFRLLLFSQGRPLSLQLSAFA